MATTQPPHPAPATALIAAVLQTQKLITNHLNSALRPLGLSFARYEVLAMMVAENGPLPMVRIVRALDRHPTTIGTLVDGLEDAGLCVRAINRSDRRSTLVTVTDKGLEVGASASRALDGVALADPQDMHRLHEGLQLLLAATRRASTAAAELSEGRP